MGETFALKSFVFMTKREIVVKISIDTGMIQEVVTDVVQKCLDYLTEALAAGETVELRNFGVFKVKTRRARIGRNPKVPEIDVIIPAVAQVKFTAGKLMREAVSKLSPQAKGGKALI
jgi:nucleoid DNA-binding protein